MRRAHANANAKTKSQHKSTATGFLHRGFPTPASNNRVKSRRRMSDPAARPIPGRHKNEKSHGSSAPPFDRIETMEFDACDGAFDAQTFKSRTKTSRAVAPSSSRRQCGVKDKHQPYWHLSGEDGCRLYRNVALWFLFDSNFCVRHAGSWTANTVEPSFR